MSTSSGAVTASNATLLSSDVNDSSASRDRADAPAYSIATLGLSRVDDALIKAVLKIAHGRSRSTWIPSEPAAAHAIIVNETDLRNAEYARVLEGRICILLRKGAPTTARTDPAVLTPPISVLNILSALDHASSQLAAAPIQEKRQSAIDGADATLADLIARLSTQIGGTVVIRCGEIGSLRLDLSTRRYAVDFPRSRLPEVLRSEQFIVAKGDVALDVGESRHLIELIWSAGLESTRTPALQKDSPMKLRRWPEFPRLPHRVEHMQLTGLLNGREMTVRELIEESALSSSIVESFVRACVVCGYAQFVQKSNVATLSGGVVSRFARGGLLDRLRKRLGF